MLLPEQFQIRWVYWLALQAFCKGEKLNDKQELREDVKAATYTGLKIGEEDNNKFSVGDELEIIDPNDPMIKKIKVEAIINDDGKSVTETHNDNRVVVKVDSSDRISKYSLLRRKI